MSSSLETLDSWRKFFKATNKCIFEIIVTAIKLAVIEFPQEFKCKRKEIAALLYSSKDPKCIWCDEVRLGETSDDGFKEWEQEMIELEMAENRVEEDKIRGGREKEGNANDGTSKITYAQAEGVFDEIMERVKIADEILRIKKVLENSKNESVLALHGALSRLELMNLSVDQLQVTNIGNAVKALVNHGADKIKNLVQKLVKNWIAMGVEWSMCTEAIINESNNQESMKCSEVDDRNGGLPSVPLEKGAFFIDEIHPLMDFSKLLDGFDDDGNLVLDPEDLRVCKNDIEPLEDLLKDVRIDDEGDLLHWSIISSKDKHSDPMQNNKNVAIEREEIHVESINPTKNSKIEPLQDKPKRAIWKHELVHEWISPLKNTKGDASRMNRNVVGRNQDISHGLMTSQKDKKSEQTHNLKGTLKKDDEKKQPTIAKPNNPFSGGSSYERPKRPIVRHHVKFDLKPHSNYKQQSTQKGELAYQQNKPKKSDEAAIQAKLDEARRKLNARNQEVEIAKMKRKIQDMEPQKLQGTLKKEEEKKQPTIVGRNVKCDMKLQSNYEKQSSQKKELASQQNAALEVKLEDAKRKLHERYQEIENGRKIQVMELDDIPQQGHGKRKIRKRFREHGSSFAATGRRHG